MVHAILGLHPTGKKRWGEAGRSQDRMDQRDKPKASP